MYIWGKRYFLVFKPDNQKNSLEIQNQNIVLSMSAKSTVKQRDAYVKIGIPEDSEGGNSIYEINEMLKENGITPLGSDLSLL